MHISDIPPEIICMILQSCDLRTYGTLRATHSMFRVWSWEEALDRRYSGLKSKQALKACVSRGDVIGFRYFHKRQKWDKKCVCDQALQYLYPDDIKSKCPCNRYRSADCSCDCSCDCNCVECVHHCGCDIKRYNSYPTRAELMALRDGHTEMVKIAVLRNPDKLEHFIRAAVICQINYRFLVPMVRESFEFSVYAPMLPEYRHDEYVCGLESSGFTITRVNDLYVCSYNYVDQHV